MAADCHSSWAGVGAREGNAVWAQAGSGRWESSATAQSEPCWHRQKTRRQPSRWLDHSLHSLGPSFFNISAKHSPVKVSSHSATQATTPRIDSNTPLVDLERGPEGVTHTA